MSEHQDDAGYRTAMKWLLYRLKRGVFDAPEMEHINAYWVREGLIKHQKAEIQRLRAALEWIVECGTDYQSINKARNALCEIKGGESDE